MRERLCNREKTKELKRMNIGNSSSSSLLALPHLYSGVACRKSRDTAQKSTLGTQRRTVGRSG